MSQKGSKIFELNSPGPMSKENHIFFLTEKKVLYVNKEHLDSLYVGQFEEPLTYYKYQNIFKRSAIQKYLRGLELR